MANDTTPKKKGADPMTLKKGQMIRVTNKNPDLEFEELVNRYPYLTRDLSEEQMEWLKARHEEHIQSIKDGTYEPKFTKKNQGQQSSQPSASQAPAYSQEQIDNAVEKCMNEGKCGPLNEIMQKVDSIEQRVSQIPQTVSSDVSAVLKDVSDRLSNIENSGESLSQIKDDLLSQVKQFASQNTQGPEQGEESIPVEDQGSDDVADVSNVADEGSGNKVSDVRTAVAEADTDQEEKQYLQQIISQLTYLTEALSQPTRSEEQAQHEEGEGNTQDEGKSEGDQPQTQTQEQDQTQEQTQEESKTNKSNLFSVRSRPELGWEG